MSTKIEITCPRCNGKAVKDKKEVTRQTKKGNPVFCSKECAVAHNAEKRTIHVPIEKPCLYCGTIFETTTKVKARSCCSHQCAHRYAQKFVDPKKISEKLKTFYVNNPHPHIGKTYEFKRRGPRKNNTGVDRNPDGTYKLTCNNCDNPFNHSTKKQKTCSPDCLQERRSLLCGGETNYKKFKYKEVWMDSSWEVELAQWFDENYIKWARDKKIKFRWIDSENISHTYYPDFYLEDYNVYVDPKNRFLQEKDKEKIDYVRNEYKIVLLSGFVDEIKEQIIKMGP